jgi:hypothetical protein
VQPWESAAVFGAIVVKFLRSKRDKSVVRTDAQRKRAPSFEAVVVKPGRNACAAATALAEQRHLGSEAPMLPLRDCDRADICQCRYVHYSDRRGGPRRKVDGALPTNQQTVQLEEQRRDQGRRADERSDDGRPLAWFKDGYRN